MDKKLAKLVQDEAVAALEAIAARHGMTVRAHGGSLADISIILKFEFKTADSTAIAAAEKAEFERYAALFGLEPSDYGAKFVINGKTYSLIALDLKRRKFPIIAVDETGKRLCFTDMMVDRFIQQRKVAS
jgi:hypothetical protein